MSVAVEIRRCLIELDIDGIIRVWRQVEPGLPIPGNRPEVLVALHMARTASRTIPMRLRAYSHRWLIDNNYPSQLPDRLKPRAERLYPRVIKSVGISVSARSPVVRAAVHDAMVGAVLEAYADGHQDDPQKVRQRMQEARLKERRGLGI